MNYSLRSALESDLESMMRIAHEGLRPHLEPSSGWDEQSHQEAFKRHFEPTKISIILIDDHEVGYFKTERTNDYSFLEGIYIGNKYRNKGLGSRVIQDLISELSTESIPLRLKVLRKNPAKQLYDRLGFVTISETDEHFTMERQIEA